MLKRAKQKQQDSGALRLAHFQRPITEKALNTTEINTSLTLLTLPMAQVRSSQRALTL